jgi:hypothetical protein
MVIGNQFCCLFAKLLGPSFYGMSHQAELIQLTLALGDLVTLGFPESW